MGITGLLTAPIQKKFCWSFTVSRTEIICVMNKVRLKNTTATLSGNKGLVV